MIARRALAIACDKSVKLHKAKNRCPPITNLVGMTMPQRKPIATSSTSLHDSDPELASRPENINISFITKDGEKIDIKGREGERVLYLAHRKGIDMEGACEASLACTTCHVYVETESEHWDKLPEATETEEDLLDMAPFLAPNSRLGCQIILSPEIDGIVLRLPRATKNFYVDGHKPQPH